MMMNTKNLLYGMAEQFLVQVTAAIFCSDSHMGDNKVNGIKSIKE